MKMSPEINNRYSADYLAPIIGHSIIGAPLTSTRPLSEGVSCVLFVSRRRSALSDGMTDNCGWGFRLVLFCSLADLDPRVGLHTINVLSPFIPVFCHSDWFLHGESCLCLDVVHPGRAWPSSPSCTWHCSLHYLFLYATPLFPLGSYWPLYCKYSNIMAVKDGLSERMKKHVLTPLRWKDWEGFCGFRGQQRKQMNGFLTKLE